MAVEVLDDQHLASATGERTLEGDSLALAIHPGNRLPGADGQPFVYYI